MLSKIKPEASLNNDSNFNKILGRFGIIKPSVTASVAVASVGILMAASKKANGKPILNSDWMVKPATKRITNTMTTVILTIDLNLVETRRNLVLCPSKNSKGAMTKPIKISELNFQTRSLTTGIQTKAIPNNKLI